MDTRKIHIAGEPNGKQQRCIRCHAVIMDNSDFRGDSFWRVGGYVQASRGGAKAVTAIESVGVRNCGRKVN